MNKTITAIVGGIFGVAMLALIVSPNGGKAIRDFFGGIGYATGVAQSPATGRFPIYPS